MRIRPLTLIAIAVAGAVSLFLLEFQYSTAASASESIDLLPPLVQVLSPPRDGVVSADRPSIILSFSDPGVGIDPATANLALDGLDVTTALDLESRTDGSWRASFTPKLSLQPGLHEAWFRVADRVGNVGSIRWSFLVQPSGDWRKTQVHGASVLGVALLPLEQVTETLDLNFRSQVPVGEESAPLSVEVWVRGGAKSGLVGLGHPLGPISAEVDEYAVNLTRGDTEMALGAVLVALPSSILGSQLAKDGLRVSARLPGPDATKWRLSGFRAQTLASQGFGLTILEFAGGAAQVDLPSDLSMRAVWTEAKEANNSYKVGTVGMGLPLSPDGSMSLEVAQSEHSPGNPARAVSAQFDGHKGRSSVNIGWWSSEAGFETPLLSSELAGTGGVHRVRLSGSHSFLRPLVANVDLISLRDHLETAEGFSTATDNASASLHYLPPGNFSYKATYRLEQRYASPGTPGHPVADTVTHQVEGSADYRGGPSTRFSSGRARLVRSYGGRGDVLGTTATLGLTKDYAAATLEGVLEGSRRYVSLQRLQTDAYRLDLILAPHSSIAFWGLRPRLTGKIGIGLFQEERSGPWSSTSKAGTRVYGRISAEITPRDTATLSGERVWGDDSDYQLKAEYRRSF